MADLFTKSCVPCRKGSPGVSRAEAETMLAQLPGWSMTDDGAWLRKSYPFPNFLQALAFTNKVGELAEVQRHHPDIALGWGYVDIRLQTHAIGGLHLNDFILAAKIDKNQ